MSRAGRHQPRHLTRGRWIGAAALVLAAVLIVLYARAITRPAPAKVASEPGPASAAAQPALSDQCRALLVAADRMVEHADGVEVALRGHKKLMDDYKSGKIDRAKAIPQGSWWRQALARTLTQGAAAADQYDTDKASYRKLAAQCGNSG